MTTRKTGLLFKNLRIKYRYSQHELSKILGLNSGQSISNIERGTSPLPSRHLVKLVELFSKEEVLVLAESLVEDYRAEIFSDLDRVNNGTTGNVYE